MKIISCGPAFRKMVPSCQGSYLQNLIQFVRPEIQRVDFGALLAHCKELLIFRVKAKEEILFRGQFEFIKESGNIIFAGSPWFDDIEKLDEAGLTVNDFAFHDPIVDLLQLVQTKKIVNEDLRKLLATFRQQKNDLKVLSLILEESVNGVIVTDTKGGIDWVNDAFYKLSGYDLHEIKGKRPGEFLQGADTDKETIAYMANQIASGQPFNCEVLNYSKSGNPYWVKISAQPLFNEDGEITHYFAFQENITDRKLSEQKVIELSKKFSYAFEKIGDNVWEHDFSTGATVFSMKEGGLLGYMPSEFSDNAAFWWKCVHPDDRQILQKNDQQYRAGIIDHHNHIYRVFHKDGSIKWILDRGVVIENDSSGKPLKIIGTHTDITNQKQLESQLKLSANRLSNLISSIQDGILVEDEHRNVLLVNKPFCDMFGIEQEPSQLVGLDCRLAISAAKNLFKDSNNFEKTINSFVSEKKSVRSIVFEMKSGVTLEMDYVPIFIDDQYKGHLWKYANITDKVNTEKQLEDQRKFYEDVLNSIPADIAVFNDKHQYLFVNPIAISDPEIRKWIIGKTDEDFCVFRNKPMHLARDRRAMFNSVVEAGKEIGWEEKIMNRQGQPEYHLRRMYPVLNNDGKVQLMIGFGINITDRKMFEEQVKLNEKRYKDLFNFSLALICTHDLSGKILDVNPSTCALLKYSEEEMIGKNITDFIPPEDKLFFSNQYLAELSVKENVEGVFRVVGKTGRIHYLLYHNHKVHEPGKVPFIIGFSQDITERRKVEDAIRKGEEKYRIIIENMNLGLIEFDKDSKVVIASKKLSEMSGYEESELIGQTIYDVLPLNRNREFLKKNINLMDRDSSDVYEIVTKTKNGEPRWWLVSSAPITSGSGDVKGAMAICLDITNQKRLEQQLRAATKQAEKSAATKEMFLANMSHEIRTPMNAILGLGKKLERTALDKQQQFYLNSINNAAANLLVIVNDILDFSKIEAGKLSLDIIGFRFDDLVKDALTVIDYKAETKGINLIYNPDLRIAKVLKGDPHRLNQVLVNLLGNSVKFTERGNISVTTKLLHDDENAQSVLIDVTDTGIGMTEEFQAVLFDKFVQADDEYTKKSGGTGLGMSIVKELVEMMNGTICVKSQKGKGTSIIIEILFEKGSEADIPRKKQNNISSTLLRNKRILLVDDNEMNRIVANVILGDYGAVVDEAVNGQECITMLENEKYDLVLMDLRMPVMNGIEATNIIRKNISATLPVIALTANAVIGERQKCLDAGMNDFISKPFEEITLINTIATQLGLSTIKESQAAEVPANIQHSLYSLDSLKVISKNNTEFIEKMITIFLSEVKKTLDIFDEARMQNDIARINNAAHKIKPSLANLGITSIQNEILQLESYPKDSTDMDTVKQLISKVEAVLVKVIYSLEDALFTKTF